MQFRSLVSGLVLLSAGLYAHADRIYDFSTVTLNTLPSGGSPDGMLTGTLTTNDARSMILSYDLTASAAGSFAGFEYTPSDSSVTASLLPDNYFQIDSTGNVDELRIYFGSSLRTNGGGIVEVVSYEHEPSGGNRFPSGIVRPMTPASVTPEPSSFALLGTGMLGVAGVLRKRFA